VTALNDRLRALRRQKALTQEQLAQMLHISRQTVSHWETGRATPDYETLGKLADILNVSLVDLLQDQAPPPSPSVPPFPAEEPSAVQTAAPAAQPRRLIWLLAAVGAVVLLVCLLFLFFQPSSKPERTIEWFQQENPRTEGQAYLHMYTQTSPVLRSHTPAEGRYAWRFELYLHEDNGVPFHVDAVEEWCYFANGGCTSAIIDKDYLPLTWGNMWIPARLTRSLSGFHYSVEPMLGVGYLIQGVDANGNELAFRHFVPFSLEYKED